MGMGSKIGERERPTPRLLYSPGKRAGWLDQGGAVEVSGWILNLFLRLSPLG